jgi:hypothetical protein
MSELKPCPMCGSDARLIDVYDAAQDFEDRGGSWWKAVCTFCLVQTKSYWDKQECIDWWNRRQLEAARSPWVPIRSESDLPEFGNDYWFTERNGGKVVRILYSPRFRLDAQFLAMYTAWMPIVEPEPYVEPTPERMEAR